MEKAGYFTGYDINIDPGVANSVATAALRFVASMMGSSIALRNGVSWCTVTRSVTRREVIQSHAAWGGRTRWNGLCIESNGVSLTQCLGHATRYVS